MRFYDHPLVRELYPESNWSWRFLRGEKAIERRIAGSAACEKLRLSVTHEPLTYMDECDLDWQI